MSPARLNTTEVASKDGTRIAFEVSGDGPALILIAGALSDRASHARLVELLAPEFTVFNYDRRGRGASGDTPPHAIEREIEDLDAIIDTADEPVLLYGSSSRGNLALQAALRRSQGWPCGSPTSSSTRAGHRRRPTTSSICTSWSPLVVAAMRSSTS